MADQQPQQRQPPPGPRGRRRRPRFQQPRYQQREYPVSEELGKRELEVETKKFMIAVMSNEQGRFVRLSETGFDRRRISFSMEKALEFRTIINEFLTEYQQLDEPEEELASERLKTESFVQGRRRFYVDLRQNERGRFVKVTMLGYNKTFIAIPGVGLQQFTEAFCSLIDKFSTGSPPTTPPSKPPPQRSSRPRPPPPRPSSETSSNPLPESREVHAGTKRFYFDTLRNDRGTFLKLTEVLRMGRRTHINIPRTCWEKMGETFAALAGELAPSEDEEVESAAGSGSEGN